MGTLTGQAIVDRQRDLVQDVDAVRWQNTEVLRWLNDGVREVCLKKPSAYTRHGSLTLDPGAKQSISALPGAWAIVDVPYNLVSGSPGRTIRKAAIADLDTIDPTWRTSEGDTVKHWVADVEPHTFFVYPAKQKTTTRTVEVVVAQTPVDATTLATVIPIDDIYANALGYYLAFRLYSKDADSTASTSAAAAYYTLFTNSLGA